jgi:hypothetical protein
MTHWLKTAIVERFRRLGPLNASLLLIGRLLTRVSGGRWALFRYYLVAQPIAPKPVQTLRAAAGQVRLVEAGDPVVMQFPRPAEVIAARFANSSSCYVAEVRGEFAGYLWLAFDGYDEDEVRCRYEFASPALSAWDYDVYVKSEYRLGRTFARLWDAANRDLAMRGVRWTFSRISAFNPNSMAAHRRMGMETLFSATFIRLGTLQLALMGAAPFVHLSWRQQSRPQLTLPLPRSGT